MFAQFAYYPFWPAVVRDPETLEDNQDLMRMRKKGQVLVEFFGTKNFSWVDRHKVSTCVLLYLFSRELSVRASSSVGVLPHALWISGWLQGIFFRKHDAYKLP